MSVVHGSVPAPLVIHIIFIQTASARLVSDTTTIVLEVYLNIWYCFCFLFLKIVCFLEKVWEVANGAWSGRTRNLPSHL